MELRYGVAAGEESIVGRIASWVADYVNENASGVEIEVFPGGELGNIIEMMDNITTGSLDMLQVAYSLAASHYAPMMVFDAPYLYREVEHMFEKTDPRESDIAREIVEASADESNIRVLGGAFQGVRHVSISEEPFYDPSGLEGRNIRAVPIDILFKTVVGMGAEATSVSFAELPSALATGSVDGQENSYSLTWNSGVWENQDYIVETGHTNLPAAVVITEEVWPDLDDDQQDVFYEAVEKAKTDSVETLEEETDQIKEDLRNEGLEIIEQDELAMEEFRTQTRGHIRQEFSQFTEKFDQLHDDTYE
jgi:TRAP-type C4-dicarboxylate transport system substrate-binding protein